jgi:hypothetical protein
MLLVDVVVGGAYTVKEGEAFDTGVSDVAGSSNCEGSSRGFDFGAAESMVGTALVSAVVESSSLEDGWSTRMGPATVVSTFTLSSFDRVNGNGVVEVVSTGSFLKY